MPEFSDSADALVTQDTKLAMGYKVVRISHDKAWFNDDDPGVRTLGWDRCCNTNEGDFKTTCPSATKQATLGA